MSTPRNMTINDHLAIETEDTVSPIQREVSRAAADAEARKERLIMDRDYWQGQAATWRGHLTLAELKLQAVLDELRELRERS
jgi:hypothetical protein